MPCKTHFREVPRNSQKNTDFDILFIAGLLHSECEDHREARPVPRHPLQHRAGRGLLPRHRRTR